MIIWADPELKKAIFKRSVEVIADYRKNALEEQKVDLDPK